MTALEAPLLAGPDIGAIRADFPDATPAQLSWINNLFTIVSAAVLIPAGVPHSYEVLEGPFEFLCMVPNGPDQIRFVKD